LALQFYAEENPHQIKWADEEKVKSYTTYQCKYAYRPEFR